MITIKKLSGTVEDAAWNEPRGVLQSIYDEPAPGVIRRVSLGEAGLILQRGDKCCGIPLSDLIALAEQHLPGFALMPQVETKNPEPDTQTNAADTNMGGN